MALSDHIAILTHASLATAVLNKLNPNKAPEYFALFAFPPEAGADLQAAALAAAQPMFGGLSNVQIGVKRNSQAKTPLPGIPGDWFVVRAASQFAPEVYSAKGELLLQSTPDGLSAIHQTFFAGKKIRANLSAYAWTYGKDGRGVSFNLAGLMDAGVGGDRLPIGNDSGSAFAKHANPNAPPSTTINQSPASATGAVGDPFGGNAQPQQAAQQQAAQPQQASADPFAQASGNAVANPFA